MGRWRCGKGKGSLSAIHTLLAQRHAGTYRAADIGSGIVSKKILFLPLDGSGPRYVDYPTPSEQDAIKRKHKAAHQEWRRKQRLMSDAIKWEAIEAFVGYGNPDAPIVFVGMEEGLADRESLHQDLLCRSAFKTIMDLEIGHRCLAKGPNLFTERPRAQRTWWVMADVMLHYDRSVPADKRERSAARKHYRTKVLGRDGGDTLMSDLLPYPHSDVKEWLYAPYGRFEDRDDYLTSVLDRRIDLLRKTISGHPRQAIVCYGRGDWRYFKKLFPDAMPWKTAGRFECSEWNQARVTLTDHFVSPYF